MIDAIRLSVDTSNWYAALALALMLPDICASLESVDGRTCSSRYASWFDRYVRQYYTAWIGPRGPVGPDDVPAHGFSHEFLRGGDCYALRCAFLHQGKGNISDQRMRQALTDFIFVNSSARQHCNHYRRIVDGNYVDSLILRVDLFCEDICKGAQAWLRDHRNNDLVRQQVATMLDIA